jgi:hypothetical protein
VAKLTIHHLEVQFHVDGDDKKVFGDLFKRHIAAWSRAYEQECARLKHSERERGFGDQEGQR